MKKHSIKLSKENAHLFISRYNKLLNKTGCLQQWGDYHKIQRFYTLCKNIWDDYIHIPTLKTRMSYVLREKIEREWTVIDIGIVMNSDKAHGEIIKWGTKIRFFGDKIQYSQLHGYSFDNNPNTRTRITTVMPSSEFSKANYRINDDEQWAAWYDRDMTRELEDSFDYDFDLEPRHFVGEDDLDYNLVKTKHFLLLKRNFRIAG